jgi:hypothetical protein
VCHHQIGLLAAQTRSGKLAELPASGSHNRNGLSYHSNQ